MCQHDPGDGESRPDPYVGAWPAGPLADDEVPWVLGTQCSAALGPLALTAEGRPVVMVEARAFARRKPYHRQKLTLLFSAMRHCRDRLRAAGYDVHYEQAETFTEGLAAALSALPDDVTLVAMAPPTHGADDGLRRVVATAATRAGAGDGVGLRLVPDERFCTTPAAADAWFREREVPYRHEGFYRWLREESGVLVADGEPVGGAWNFDDRNRETPPDDWTAPPVPTAEPDDLTADTAAWVAETFETWGDDRPLRWPVTPDGARAWLDQFVAERLPVFGPYQDAVQREEWAMAHSLLAPAINVGLLHPRTVIERIEAANHEREDVPIESAEGAIRQLLGWREFVRHAYRLRTPGMDDANRLGADEPLPDAFWTGETDMACLAGSVADVHERGYAHHIQRLMVLANVATLWGARPAALNEWFHATFVDASHWVTTPNVVEMGAFADGAFATKPYVSSANYLQEMTDYCEGCRYDPDATTGAGACPLNALFWDFLDRNEGELRSNHRIAPLYGTVDDRRESGEMAAIRDRVATLRERERERATGAGDPKSDNAVGRSFPTGPPGEWWVGADGPDSVQTDLTEIGDANGRGESE